MIHWSTHRNRSICHLSQAQIRASIRDTLSQVSSFIQDSSTYILNLIMKQRALGPRRIFSLEKFESLEVRVSFSFNFKLSLFVCLFAFLIGPVSCRVVLCCVVSCHVLFCRLNSYLLLYYPLISNSQFKFTLI